MVYGNDFDARLVMKRAMGGRVWSFGRETSVRRHMYKEHVAFSVSTSVTLKHVSWQTVKVILKSHMALFARNSQATV
jgi:hypothetical protein